MARRIGGRTLVSVLVVAGCAGDGRTSVTAPVSCNGGTSTTRVAITDLTAGCYLESRGGLYPNGTNELSDAHLAAGRAAAAQIVPLDVNGAPSTSGKYVLLSVGMSNTTQEFCNDAAQVRSCVPQTFMTMAAADAAVNHGTLVVVNGALGGRSAASWVSSSSVEYDRVRDTWLTPLGLSEKQVQVAWVKVANPGPTVKLPTSGADAFVLESQIAQIARALKSRYPNLRQAFVSSRIYAGYATTTLNPEPYAYENGFSVKWAIESQIVQMAGGAADAVTGDLRYDNGVAPWIGWGPYLWAAGTNPRLDGLTWAVSDFGGDGTHPNSAGAQKVATLLLTFFKASPVTRCWFLAAGQAC